MFIYASTNKEIVEKVENEPLVNKEFLESLPREGVLFSLLGNSAIKEFRHSVGKSGGGNTGMEFSIRFLDSQLGNSFESVIVNSYNLNVLSEVNKYFSNVDNLLQDEFKSLYDKEVDNFVYIVYGYGNKKSGPHACSIKSFNVISVKGVVEYNLTLTPIARDLEGKIFATKVGAKASTRPSEMYFEGNSNEIKLNLPLNYGKEKYERINKSRFGPVQPPQLAQKYIDFHLLVKDTLKDFFRNIFGTYNVLVLLPDIGVVCADKIIEYYTSTTFQTKNSKPRESLELLKFLEASDDEKTYGSTDSYIFKLNLIKSFVNQFRNVFEIEQRPSVDTFKIKKLPQTQEGQIPEIGSITYPTIEPIIPEDNTDPYFLKEQTRFRLTEERVADYVDKYPISIRMRGYPDIRNETQRRPSQVTQVVNRLFSIIKQLSGFDGYSFGYYVETNSKYNDFIKSDELKLTDLLSGDDQDSENLVIVGEETLINQYLYGINRLGDITEENVNSFTQNYPLHPLDEAVLTSEYFKSKLSNLLPNRQHFSPIFVDINNTTEGVGINDYKGEVGVLDYTINDNNSYRGAVDNVKVRKLQNTQKVIGRISAKIADYLNPAGKLFNPEELRELVEQAYAINSFDYDKTDTFFSNLIDKLETPDPYIKQEVQSFLNYELEKLKVNKDPLGPVAIYDDTLLLSEGKIRSAIQQNLATLGLSVSVTTQFCPQYGSYYLVGKSAKLKVSPRKFRLKIPQYYTIVGYTHTMTNNSLISKFELVRQFNS